MMQLLSSVKRRMSSREGYHATSTSQDTTAVAASGPPVRNQSPSSIYAESAACEDLSSRPSQSASASRSRPAKRESEQQPQKCEKSTDQQQLLPVAKIRSFDTPPGLLLCRASPAAFMREPYLRDVPSNEVSELLRRKISLCATVIFDFKPASADLWLEEKEAKKATLTEILDFVNSADRRPIPLESVIEPLIEMIGANIFRPLPPSSSSLCGILSTDPDELEPILEVSWSHLQLVYEILLRLVMANEVNPKIAKKYIDPNFVLRLLDLFASEDPRERDYLKTIMHRVYGKIMALRGFIRKSIQHVFFRYIFESDSQHGVSELLEILGSIINGFAQPLKEEHKLFLKRSMIPLHKSRHLVTYHQQLTYCMTQYIEKDHRLVEPIIKGLLRYWPVTNTPKEVLLLNEIEEILELTMPTEFVQIMEPLFHRMALCIQSPHFQVSERVLFLWNNSRIVKLINQNKNELFPIVISALYKNTKDHWNVTVHGLTYNVYKLLAEADPHLFDHCNDENLAEQERKEKEQEARRQAWKALREQHHHSST